MENSEVKIDAFIIPIFLYRDRFNLYASAKRTLDFFSSVLPVGLAPDLFHSQDRRFLLILQGKTDYCVEQIATFSFEIMKEYIVKKSIAINAEPS